jgi:hypothetical protein
MNTIGCPVCSKPLSVTVARGRKSLKPFIMLKCSTDGRHFRGFITDQEYMKRILSQTGMVPGGVQSEKQTI